MCDGGALCVCKAFHENAFIVDNHVSRVEVGDVERWHGDVRIRMVLFIILVNLGV